ncbi:Cobalt/zinc/cadmium efflux RND transporter [Enhygromyxa salina]|uniref:Cobalt/zinc/cadmium efflux RND transporter n=1 Tax=Enhygromyxa salina TaxID=215803 RepID=A0A0C2DI05_9BACT|nr:efflux RND transporter periplasmic adaptor subunit [Enhygromyxa salina]KIG19312.1 Cobalt/zinc/cadmium efflux RND transporter [Enhygromyxa salina]
MTRSVRVAAVVLACAWLVACNAPAESHEKHDEHGELGEHGEHAQATTWVRVEQASDASLLELPARIVASPESHAHLDAPLQGTVVAASVRTGDRVEAGDPIVELRIPAVLEAAAVLAGTSKQIGSHKARRERLEELRAAGLVGATEVFDVDSGLGRLSAERRLALATLAAVGVDASERGAVLLRGTVILAAPVAGVVAQLDAIPGEVVEPGEKLARILGRGPARIEVAFGAGHPDTSPEFAGATLEFEGLDGSRILLAPTPVATAVEPGLGRVLAWYETATAIDLPDGVRGRVQVRSGDASLLEVPRAALRLHEGRAWVGRRPQGDGPPDMIEVKVLRSVGSSALIHSEALAVGDEIAADANTVLMIGRDPDSLGGGGHSH